MAAKCVVVVVPVQVPSAGGVGAMAGLFIAVVVFAVAACTAVSCTDFGPGSTIPTGSGCAPFCTATATAIPGVAR
jgi:hypothetical protein